MNMDRKLVWLLIIILLAILLWWALDHVLFPTLPMPAGTPSITK